MIGWPEEAQLIRIMHGSRHDAGKLDMGSSSTAGAPSSTSTTNLSQFRKDTVEALKNELTKY